MTPQQNACLIAIRDLTVDGVTPTYEQLQIHLGLRARSGVFRLVQGLERQGFVRRSPGSHYRRIEIVERKGAGLSDARIAAMSDDALESAVKRINAALSHRRALSQGMREMAA